MSATHHLDETGHRAGYVCGGDLRTFQEMREGTQVIQIWEMWALELVTEEHGQWIAMGHAERGLHHDGWGLPARRARQDERSLREGQREKGKPDSTVGIGREGVSAVQRCMQCSPVLVYTAKRCDSFTLCH